MSKLKAGSGEFSYQWASDVDFDGIRLEIMTVEGDVWFDVSVPDEGGLAVNTFSKDVPVEVVLAAVAIARQR